MTAKVEIPAFVRGDELITATGIFGKLIGEAQQFRTRCSRSGSRYFIGNPFTDVPELRCYSLVCTNNDAPLAERAARQLANDFWPHRHEMQARLMPVDECVQLAIETPGTVAMVDAADATSSGASGDSNVILRGLIKAGLSPPGADPHR